MSQNSFIEGVEGAVRARREAPHTVSCVVPAYNEEANLLDFLHDLHAALRALGPAFEIVLVDDGSRDGTRELGPQLAAPLGIHYIRLSRNFGKEAALTAGLDAARGDVVFLMDADYQHPLAVLAEMLEQWRAGFDVVYGVRRDRSGEALVRRVGTKLLYDILAADAPVKIPPDAGDFRLLDRKVVAALKSLPERTRFMKGLYAWVGFDTVAVPFDVCERRHGDSRFGLRRLVRLACDGITSFSNLPLRVWSGFGLLISVASLGYGAWVVGDTLLFGARVAGWPTIVAGLMFFSGLQLMSIGIIGEYLGRVFEEVKRRPIYLVGEEIDCSALARETAGARARDSRESHPPLRLAGG